MKYKKERTVTFIVQTFFLCLILLIPATYIMIKSFSQLTSFYFWLITSLLFASLLVSSAVGYFISYRALLATASGYKSLWIGYVAMLIIWMFCTLCILVLFQVSASLDCHQLSPANQYQQCMGTTGQQISFTLIALVFSFMYAIPCCLVGSIISYLTRYFYKKFN